MASKYDVASAPAGDDASSIREVLTRWPSAAGGTRTTGCGLRPKPAPRAAGSVDPPARRTGRYRRRIGQAPGGW